MDTAILLAAYGSRHPRLAAVAARVEERVRAALPGLPVFWAATSRNVRRQAEADSPDQALERLAALGVRRVVVQALHIVPGSEYDELLAAVERWRPRFAAVAAGAPLLAAPADVERAAAALHAAAAEDLRAGRAVVFMGHGAAGAGQAWYSRLAQALRRLDERLLLGTLEGHPDDDSQPTPDPVADAAAVRDQLLARGLGEATLRPFLFHAGMHAEHDLAGDRPGSWQAVLAAAGIAVRVELVGAAEDDALLGIWLDHLRDAAGRLAGS